MRSSDLIALAVILAMTGAAFWYQEISPTGRAVQSFSASVTVLDVSFQNTSAAQQGIPATGGQNINFTMPVTYSGGGVVNVTLNKPVGFTEGVNWFITENGTVKLVVETAQTLTWEANLSAGSATLGVQALAPVLVVLAASAGDTQYVQDVRVGSEIHLVNVTASATVDTRYSGWTLTQNGTDVGVLYGLQVSGATATWTGFNLSSQEFTLSGSKAGSSSGGGGGGNAGGGDRWQKPENVTLAPMPEPSVWPRWITITVREPQSVDVTVSNPSDAPIEVWGLSMASFLSAGSVTVPARGEAQLPILVTPTVAGERSGRVILTDGDWEQHVFVEVTYVTETAPEQVTIIRPAPPRVEQPLTVPVKEWPIAELNIALLIIAAMLGLSIGVRKLRS